MDKFLEKIIAEEDRQKIVEMFDDLILRAYGEKSMDGRSFNKSPELRKAFEDSACYDQLFFDLLSNTDSLTEFVNGLIPEGIPKADQPVALVDNA